MAGNLATLHHGGTERTREAPVGFSWTTLFFGPFPMLFRGNWKWFLISLVLAICTFGLSNLVLMFMINRLHLKDLVNDGYRVRHLRHGDVALLSSKTGIPVSMLSDSKERASP